MDHRSEPGVKRYFELATAKRPFEELYDLSKDPDQLTNVAGNATYSAVQQRLAQALDAELK